MFDEQFFRHSFLYPDITGENQEIQDFVAEDIIEISHKSVLEKSSKILIKLHHHFCECVGVTLIIHVVWLINNGFLTGCGSLIKYYTVLTILGSC